MKYLSAGAGFLPSTVWRFPIHGGYPQIIHVIFRIFREVNHPDIGGPHFGTPPQVITLGSGTLPL
jgi:hypothetical protein